MAETIHSTGQSAHNMGFRMSSTRTAIMKITLHALVAVLAALGTANAQSAPQRIAVLDFHDNSTGSVTPEEILYLSDLVRGSARSTLPTDSFVLMTRENILELLPEGRTLADCMGDCAVETGRKIGADYVANGEVTIFAGEIRVTVNLHETSSGNLLGQVRAGAPKLLNVEKDLNKQILDLLAPLRGRPGDSTSSGQEEHLIGGEVKAWSASGVAEEVVAFDTAPEGAIVEIDGQPVAETPCKRALLPGVYQIGLKKVRYVAHTQALEIKSGQPHAVSVALTPDFGWISVESDPAGLPVSIDGKPVGNSPLTDLEIDTGPHDVLIAAENYHSVGRHVLIGRAEKESVVCAPVPRNGGLKVIALDSFGNATEARVRVDGVEAGRAYEPLTLLRGKHQIQLDGQAGIWSGEVMLEEAQLVELPAQLANKDTAERTKSQPRDPNMGQITQMVGIPAGTFAMGSPASEFGRDSDETQRQVNIASSFMISSTEVTQAQYVAVMGVNPSQFKGAGLPVERVTWLDAVLYCNELSARENLVSAYRVNKGEVVWNYTANGYRLPTEAEWEYACRAGAATTFNVGNSENELELACWYGKNSGLGGTHPVGLKEPNAWGLFDMHGNVWEWCWDGDDQHVSSVRGERLKSPALVSRVARGGSWSYEARYCRSADRIWFNPAGAFYNLGFRVARSVAK